MKIYFYKDACVFELSDSYKYTFVAQDIFDAKKIFISRIEREIDDEINRQFKAFNNIKEEIEKS